MTKIIYLLRTDSNKLTINQTIHLIGAQQLSKQVKAERTILIHIKNKVLESHCHSHFRTIITAEIIVALSNVQEMDTIERANLSRHINICMQLRNHSHLPKSQTSKGP